MPGRGGGGGPLFAAVDVGTTGARAVAVDLEGTRVCEVRRPYPTSLPRPGWAEQDGRLWADNAVAALAGLPARVRRRVAAVGLTGQSPSVVPVGRSGRPVGPAMIYRDNRAVAEAAEVTGLLGARALHRLTGHSPEAFHVGPKVLWLRRHRPDVFARTRWFLQARDVVLTRLTGEVLTDESHAAATALFDLRAHRWAKELFDALDLDPGLFPPAVPSWIVGGTLRRSLAATTGLTPGLPVVIGAGDSQCVAFGAGVVGLGPVSDMSGASTCVNSAVTVPRRDLRITHYAHVVPGWFTTELGANTTGASLDWARSRLGFSSFDQLARAAASGRRALARTAALAGPKDAAPLFLPYLGDGERDDPSIRGAVIGLSQRHDRATLAYALVEGVAAGVVAMVGVLHRAGSPVEELRVSGGGARTAVLGQVKADLLGVPVLHLRVDASAVGAALLGAQATEGPDAVAVAIGRIIRDARRFEPDPAMAAIAANRMAWFSRVRPSPALHHRHDVADGAES